MRGGRGAGGVHTVRARAFAERHRSRRGAYLELGIVPFAVDGIVHPPNASPLVAPLISERMTAADEAHVWDMRCRCFCLGGGGREAPSSHRCIAPQMHFSFDLDSRCFDLYLKDRTDQS